MADQQDRPARAGAAQPRDQIPLARIGAQDFRVARGKSGVAQALRHGFGGGGRAANRIGGVDFDELLEYVARELLRRVIGLRAERATREAKEKGSRK